MAGWEFHKGACCLYCKKHICECPPRPITSPFFGIPVYFDTAVPKHEVWLVSNGRIEITRLLEPESDYRNRQRIW